VSVTWLEGEELGPDSRVAMWSKNRYLPCMAKRTTKSRVTAAASIYTTRNSRPGKVKFGSAVISGAKPNAKLVQANVERSTEALERVTAKLAKPGVSLRAKKGVPRFSISENEAGVFIRRLDGRTERGRLVNGVFEVID